MERIFLDANSSTGEHLWYEIVKISECFTPNNRPCIHRVEFRNRPDDVRIINSELILENLRKYEGELYDDYWIDHLVGKCKK
jgi:hypothetical protein